LARQSKDFPVNLVTYATVNRNTLIDETIFPDLKSSDRQSYATQLLVSRRFSDKFSFQLAPTFIRENLQNLNVVPEEKFNQFALGFGGRYKLSKRVSLNAEYVYNTSRSESSPFDNSYAFGLDFETGGHVFQLLFTNSQSSNEPGFMSSAEGDMVFGFNVVRVF
jgi:predicted porin